MPCDGYTRGEIAFLLGLDRELAIDMSVAWRDSVGSSNPDGPGPPTAGEEWDPVLLIARWTDVQRARRKVLARRADRAAKLGALAAQMRGEGATEEEVSEALGVHRLAARRRYGDFLDELLTELGESSVREAMSEPPACLHCGRGTRVRSEVKRRVTEGGRRVTRTVVVQSSMCAECLEAAAPRRKEAERRRRQHARLAREHHDQVVQRRAA